ncbi:MAG TPA: DedA family protein [Pseudonocardiaceae bacterium]|jgi:membrane-associated protein|nr:DedA family protein [Pseudonocardiaceae bacterium]
MATDHHSFPFGHLETAGPVMVWVIVLTFVFIECAFIIGLFLPGDGLLFAAGVVLAQHDNAMNAWALSVAAVVVAVAGNQLGYYIGRQTGMTLLGKRSMRVLTPERLDRAQKFLNQHGWWSVVVARWVPWVRTLAPLIAGAARMRARRFLLATTVGAVLWVPTLVLLGYYGAGLLGAFPWLKTTATTISIVFFVAGTGYGLWRYRQETQRPRQSKPREPAEATLD